VGQKRVIKMKRMLAVMVGTVCLVGCSSASKPDVPLVIEQSIQVKQEKNEKSKEVKERDPIDDYMMKMTLEEKVGQLFMIAVRRDQEGKAITEMTPEVKRLLEEIPVGGIVLFSENVETEQQVRTLISKFQELATIPMWIGVDEEGGRVSRISNNTALCKEPFKNALDLAGDASEAYSEAKRMGKILKDLGFNLDFAPVADIYNNPENRVIGRRSFGKSAEAVVPMVTAFAKGLTSEGIIPVIKHFPGHGNTVEDSHNGLAYVNKSLEMLEKEELVPFKAAVLQAQVPMMMVGHLVVPEIDPEYPATLSKLWGDYVAKHFPEDLITITDAMEMGAITNHYTSAQSAIRVIESGYDMILMPANLQQAYDGVLEACRSGRISQRRLDQSVRKILSKKVEHNLGGMHTLVMK
ncbi:MAG: glycoside hydrolase family 3 protein, partial [Cellulosilyticaceae bacterium]